MPCSLCEKFVHIPIKAPDDLNKIIQQLNRAVRWKDMASMGKTDIALPFSELGHNNWHDSVSNYFTCLHCGQLFHLSAETYHGSGGYLQTAKVLPDNLIPDEKP